MRADLEHVLRAAGAITNHLVSDEVDINRRDRPDLADLIDGAIGELSFFHDELGYYAQGATLLDRLAALPLEAERRRELQSLAAADFADTTP